MTDLPPPPVPPNCDLRNYPYLKSDVVRLRDSDMAAVEDAEGFRAAVLLRCAAWHQVPAGSIPNDDTAQCRLAGYGRARKLWARAKAAGALSGFELCSDGRLYHRVVAEKALEVWEQRQRMSQRGRAGNSARWDDRKKRQPAASHDERSEQTPAIAGEGDARPQKDAKSDRTDDATAIAETSQNAGESDRTRIAEAISLRSHKDRYNRREEKKDSDPKGLPRLTPRPVPLQGVLLLFRTFPLPCRSAKRSGVTGSRSCTTSRASRTGRVGRSSASS